jgi:hypothetical protein
MTDPAITVYQDFLDLMDEALMTGDAEAFLARVFLPHVIETEDTTILIDNPQTARQHFDDFTRALRAQGVDGYTRVAREAAFDGPDKLHGRHQTFLTSQGKLVVPAFDNETNLERRDTVWGSIGTRHHARYVSWPNLLPKVDRP